MSDAERAFVGTVAQIVPVILLALVIETRLFRFTHADAIAFFKQARHKLRTEMSGFDYWGWRALASFRRWGLGISLSLGLVVVLAAVEVLALYLIAHDTPAPDRVYDFFIGGIGVGVLAVGVLPVLGSLIRRNVELSLLEREVELALEAERKRKTDQTRASALDGRRTQRWWIRRFRRR